jgi:hypothetical protein
MHIVGHRGRRLLFHPSGWRWRFSSRDDATRKTFAPADRGHRLDLTPIISNYGSVRDIAFGCIQRARCEVMIEPWRWEQRRGIAMGVLGVVGLLGD